MAKYDTSEQLELVLMECLQASIAEFRKDLERRIVIVLHVDLPKRVTLNMAREIAAGMSAFIGSELINSGSLANTLRRLL